MARLPAEGGWSGRTGAQLLQVLDEHCARLALVVERRSGQPADPHRAADLTSRAWELLATRPGPILAASNPWAYLTRCLVTAGVNAAVADKLLVRDLTVQGGMVPLAAAPRRVGEQVDALHSGASQGGEQDRDDPFGFDWGWALRRLHADLVAAGAPATVTAMAIDRVVEVVVSHRRGRREAAAKRDCVIVGLGLSPGQASALVALVAGTRRGGVEESLWARLHDGPTGTELAVTPSVRGRIESYVRGFDDVDLKLPA